MEIIDLMTNGFKILFSRSRYQHFLPKTKCEKGKYLHHENYVTKVSMLCRDFGGASIHEPVEHFR